MKNVRKALQQNRETKIRIVSSNLFPDVNEHATLILTMLLFDTFNGPAASVSVDPCAIVTVPEQSSPEAVCSSSAVAL